MISIRMLKLWWLDLPIKISNVILGSENINFNQFQIFDALSEINCKKSFELC